MMRFLLFTFCCLSVLHLNGQCPPDSLSSLRELADSLHQEGRKATTYIVKFNRYNEAIEIWECIGKLYGYSPKDELDAAKSYGNRARTIADNITYFNANLKQGFDDINLTISTKQRYLDSIPQSKLKFYGGNIRQRAKIYVLMGDYEKAIEDQKEAIKIFNNVNEFESIANTLNEMGMVYREKGDFQASVSTLNEALDVTKDDYLRGQIHQNLGNSYDDLKEFEKTIQNYNQALKYYKTSITELPHRVEDIKSDIADLNNDITITYRKLRNFDKAHTYLENAKKDPAYHNNKGDIYRDENQLDSALYHHHQALVEQITNFDENINNTPTDDQLKNVSTKPDLLIYLASKAKTANLIGDNKLALATYHAYDHTVGMMRREHASDQTKLHWIAGVRPVYEQAIKTALEADDTTLAFDFVEKSRAVLLMDRLRDLDAKAFSGIPESLLQEEMELSAQLASADNDNKRDSIENQLNVLIDNFEENYPEYYALKYDLSTPDISSVQYDLDDNTTLIEYFYGDSTIYVFFISKNDVKIESIPRNTTFDNHLSNFRSFVLNDNLDGDEEGTLYKASYELYSTLFSNYLNKKTEQLIIIPDGNLYGIPFEAFTMDNSRSKSSFFINKYIITYHYSAQAYVQKDNQREKTDKNNTFLGVAPLTYKIEGDTLSSLDLGKTFMKNLPSRLKATTLIDNAATAQNFKDTAQNFRIIHLHTHAEAGETEPHIVFKHDKLYLNDLYGLPLNADMITMAACKTNMGKLYEGEGVMSLARGMTYQGVESVVATLESVPESSTTEIMTYFYKNLMRGQNKAKALHHAKLKYLKNGNKSPVYWAAPVHIGDTRPLFEKSYGQFWWFLLVLVLVVYFCFRVFRKS